MPRRGASVTQADISRAIRAMRDAGYAHVRVVMRNGAAIIEAANDAGEAAMIRPEPEAVAQVERIVPL